MEIVEILGVIFVGGFQGEAALPVDVNDEFDAGGAFGEGDVAVGVVDYGGGAHGVQGDVFWWAQEGAAIVFLELVGDFEFFAQPDYAVGLRVA